MKTKVLSTVFFVIAIGLAFYLYRAVKGPMEEKVRIEKAEKLVIQKLELIREAQKAFVKVNGVYAGTWDSLIAFADTGVIPNIQLKERPIPRPDRPWLGDSIAITQDTLELIPAKAYILEELAKNAKANPIKDFDSKRLPYKIGIDEKFVLFTDKLPMGGTFVSVIEVKDGNPVDKTRKEDHDLLNRRPIKFGSRIEVSTSGSWQ